MLTSQSFQNKRPVYRSAPLRKMPVTYFEWREKDLVKKSLSHTFSFLSVLIDFFCFLFSCYAKDADNIILGPVADGYFSDT